MENGTLFLNSELKNEIDLTKSLQKKLLSLDEKNFQDVLNWIMKSLFFSSKEKMFKLIHAILTAYDYRPKYQPYFPLLTSKIINQIESNAKEYLITLIKRFFIDDIDRNSRRLYFYHECMRLNIFSLKDNPLVIDIIKSKNNWTAFFWFSPEIYEHYHAHYKEILNSSKSTKRTDLLSYLEELPYLSANNWEMHRKLTINGENPDKISQILRNDDIKSLQELSTKEDFNFNHIINPCIFERCVILNHKPKIIQAAAFFSSTNCFKFLLLNGADPDVLDNDRMTTFQYAIAGGNPEIIRLLEQNNCLLSGALQISALYHQYSIFQWLITSHAEDCKIDLEYCSFGTVLSQSIFSNNLEIFFRHFSNPNFNPNNEIYYGETSFSSAVYNGNIDMVKFFLSIRKPQFNSPCIDSLNPIVSSTKHGYTFIVLLLLEYYTKNDDAHSETFQKDLDDALSKAKYFHFSDIIEILQKYKK